MSVAVTGATGFVGRQLCRHLEHLSIEARPLVRSEVGAPDNARLTDYRSASSLSAALRGVDVVIHLAARAHILREWSATPAQEFHEANVELTKRVAAAAVNGGLKRFVYVSSAGVLGESSPPGGFSDASEPNPSGFYARSKYEAEAWLQQELKGSTELVIVRPPLVFGPHAIGNFGRLLRGVLSGWPLPVRGLRAPRSLIGVRNLCGFLSLCATHAAAPGPPLLIADPEPTSLSEIAAGIANVAGRRDRTFHVPELLLKTGLRLVGRHEDAVRMFTPFVVHSSSRTRAMTWHPPHGRMDELAWCVEEYLRE